MDYFTEDNARMFDRIQRKKMNTAVRKIVSDELRGYHRSGFPKMTETEINDLYNWAAKRVLSNLAVKDR